MFPEASAHLPEDGSGLSDLSARADLSDRAAYLRGSPPLLARPFLDRFTRQHPAGPLGVFAPLIVVAATVGVTTTGTTALLLIGAGYLSWTLTEYWVHRILFHWQATEGTTMARVHWVVHGVHHEHPDDPGRLVLPLAVTVPATVLLGGVFRLTLGPERWLPFGSGFAFGYLLYDMTHYHLHRHRPRTRLGKALRRRHLLHHFDDDRRGFGVSAPWWDLVFRTASNPGRTS